MSSRIPFLCMNCGKKYRTPYTGSCSSCSSDMELDFKEIKSMYSDYFEGQTVDLVPKTRAATESEILKMFDWPEEAQALVIYLLFKRNSSWKSRSEVEQVLKAKGDAWWVR